MVATRLIRAFEPVIGRLLAGVRQLEGWLDHDDDWVEADRRRLFEWADVLLRPLGRPTIREVGPEDHIYTVAASPDIVERVLAEHGYQRNLASTRKYRTHHNGGRQWAVGSWVRDPPDTPDQHHVYLFARETVGWADVYAHSEPSVRRPVAHHGGEMIDHGVAGPLLTVFDEAGVDAFAVRWD